MRAISSISRIVSRLVRIDHQPLVGNGARTPPLSFSEGTKTGLGREVGMVYYHY